MPWARSPPSLGEILCTNIAQSIISKYPKTEEQIQAFYRQRNSIRDYYSQLPPIVFEQLADTAFEINKSSARYITSFRHNYARELYLLEIFLQKHTRNVSLNTQKFTTQSFSRVLELLKDNCSSLVSVDFKSGRSVSVYLVTEDYQSLTQTFSLAANLAHLTLRGICTDNLLAVIGRECHALTALDVSLSPITDVGLNLLTQNVTVSTDAIGEDNSIWKSTFWGLPDVFPPVSHLLPVRDLISQENNVKYYSRTKNPLCSTLRKLYLDGSSPNVTYRSMLVVLELLPNLEVLGNSLESLIIHLQQKQWHLQENQSESLKLKTVEVTHVTNDNMRLITSLFPGIKDLKCQAISRQVTIDNIPALESLVVEGVINGHHLNLLTPYFASKGQSLKELHLSLVSPVSIESNISSIISNCTNLISLCIKNRFDPLHLSYEPIQNNSLTVVCLDSSVVEDCLINLLKRVPTIQKIFIQSIRNKSENFINKICDVFPRPQLKELWLNTGYLLETEQELIIFLNAFNEIKVLGKLPPGLQKYGLKTMHGVQANYANGTHHIPNMNDINQLLYNIHLLGLVHLN